MLAATEGAMFVLSIGSEAVEPAGPAGCNQVRLTAALRSVRRIPGGGIISATLPIMVPDLRTSFTAASPVLASLIRVAGECSAIQLRTRQDIVLVRGIAATVKDLALLTN
jgi:hypothetical protein